MSQVSYIVEFSIQDGQVESFKEKAQHYAHEVKADEPNTLGYQWYLSEDGSKCLVHETFTDSDALLAHLAHVGPTLPDLLEIAPITRLEVLGDASQEARAALQDFAPSHFEGLTGFTR